jgi:hydrogenase large subunit
MYRGIEKLLKGRGALDGLVITPRICGICNMSHLAAAVRALDMIVAAQLPPDAVRIRDLSLMAEKLQSDLRHAFLMFTTDFANPLYQAQPLYEEAVRRYTPLKGETVIETVKETKRILELVAIIGGQWPHSSFMVPGGIVSVPSAGDLLQCRHLLQRYRRWYERRVLGCAVERWLAVQNKTELEGWLEESPNHRDSDLGFYLRFGRAIGLDKIGRGCGNFISFGGSEGPSGFARAGQIEPLDQRLIAEHVAYSWYVDYEGGRHPSVGETSPYATGFEGRKYSWAKAPRYNGLPAETGPLADMLMARHPLVTSLVAQEGPSTFVRELARMIRPAALIPVMERLLAEISGDNIYYISPGELVQGEGFGLVGATRGALGHWVRIEDGLIDHYQIITPTAWNASPRDTSGARGPVEEALIGTIVKDRSNPIELGHVVRSFDACLVCTVH